MGAHVAERAHERGTPRWAAWQGGEPYTLGVEEEVMLLDPADWCLAQRIQDVLAALPEGMRTYVGAETHASAVELHTDPHATVRESVAQLHRLRVDLAGALDSLGLAAAAAGTHPTAVWSEVEITPAERYDVIHRTMRELAGREPTYALHVHVGVPHPERAIELYNRLRAHLPTLLALSGNSPFWQGRDAGFASTRTVLFHAFPRTGMPRRYMAYDEWVDAVDLQIRAGALPEPTFLWWDVRPQPKLGTVEVRVMDAQAGLEETAALVALVQAIARLELEEGYVAGRLVAAEEVLAENRFIAARDGMDARLIDTTRETLRPVGEILDDLLAAATPHAEALGCADALAGVPALAADPGAARQRRLHAAGATLPDVVAALARRFAG
ncbi:MAG TPA: YbdK family carboxylate-amine ligase [Conexibacter sp.]|nr:YbdK family carboxylate-amine ligase [Conexibacter sp.]